MTRLFLAAVAAMLLIAGCGGGGGDDDFQGAPPPSGGGSGTLPPPASAPALKTVLAAKYGMADFPIGAAIEPASVGAASADRPLLLKHFSSVTAENAMKPDTVWPSQAGNATLPAAAPNFVPADAIYDWAIANGIKVRGHTLLWHQTAPEWFFAGSPTRVTLKQRLCQYIDAVVRRYPQIYAWDVVNEVASDTQNAANPYRTASRWYLAYQDAGVADPGFAYVSDAFDCAATARIAAGRNSGNMKLMLNDYNTELPGKRANVVQIVQSLLDASVPIDGVGHQFHLLINADVAQVTAAFTAVEGLNSTLVNHVTELDVSIYADPGECFSARTIPPCLANVGSSPSQTLLSQQALKYRALFNAFNRPSVTSVSLWGIADNHTWLNSFPVNRVNHPLLFDASGNPKWAFWAVVDPTITVP
jgi:endo-1,4-beta-xylanase